MDAIKTEEELEFVIFCIENIAACLGADAGRVYDALTAKSDLLQRYVVPSYRALHTQGKEYIVQDILAVMREENITV